MFLVFSALVVIPADPALAAYMFVVGPLAVLISVALITYALVGKSRTRRPALLLALAVVWLLTPLLFVIHIKYQFAIRTRVRWLVSSEAYKKKLLAEPADEAGDLKHLGWDSWGWRWEQHYRVFSLRSPRFPFGRSPARAASKKCRHPL